LLSDVDEHDRKETESDSNESSPSKKLDSENDVNGSKKENEGTDEAAANKGMYSDQKMPRSMDLPYNKIHFILICKYAH
jgi:hypothetical protein